LLGYLGNDIRYPLYWGCNLVHFQDGYEPPEKLAIGIPEASANSHKFLPAIGRFQAVLPAIYDPILLLFYRIADVLLEKHPVSASEIVERSEQVFQKREQDDYGHIWVIMGGYSYPAELFTIARERL